MTRPGSPAIPAADGTAAVPSAPSASRPRRDPFAGQPRTAALDTVVEAVRDGEAITVLTGSRGVGKTALLDAAVARLAPAVHFLRLGNPLSGPLTLGRILIQFGSGTQDVSDAGELDAVLRALRQRVGGESRVVVAVEQAETLAPQALLFLGTLPTLPAVGLPGFQLLLVGGPELLALLAQDRFQELRGRVGTQVVLEAHDAPVPEAPGEATRPDRTPDSAARRPRRRLVGAPALLTLLACAVLAAVLVAGRFAATSPDRGAPLPAASLAAQPPAVLPSSLPSRQEGEVPGPEAGPAQGPSPAQAAPSADDAQAARRREFEAFLDRQGGAPASLSPAQREALFQEYLAWRERLARNPPAGPADQAASPGR